ncbi:signal transduction histidine kinase [Nonomuraea fuscirosea]|uniref:histidine kinase n=1 Tax=Nonomuraea fuscirosea TaxID=1291556 RepID=A0A2T0N0D0_9ACTN|nr:HAMP domain-containing sensor histidine kinase [Nonomuraea fuscirosea]PRX65274.1 signal transduction histidine kinase [Nonomuraea fuscirosea]
MKCLSGPVRRRCALIAGAAAVAVSILFAALLMILFHRLSSDRVHYMVDRAADTLALRVERGQVRNPIDCCSINQLQVVGPTGQVEAASRQLQGEPALSRLVPLLSNESTATEVVCGQVIPGPRPCSHVVRHQVYRDEQRWYVFAAAPAIPFYVHPSLVATFIAGVLCISGAVAYSARRIVGASLAPVGIIRSSLDEINATNLSRRVPVPAPHDEIHDVAESINYTLGRLENAIEQQRCFASDASHDLRNPITAMRAEVEDAMLDPDQPAVSVLGDTLLTHLDRMHGICADLLIIARLETEIPGRRDRVDLGDLVAAEHARRHSAKQVNIDTEPGVIVASDRLLLARLVGNLLDNAERHAETTITITIHRTMDVSPESPHGSAVLEVLDDGAGIPPDKREMVFQRFVRLDESRQRDPAGTGLGLAISRQIAEAGGGTLTIADSPGGARFVLRLPAVPP